jgi:tripartite motif-containing protein 71
MRFQQTLRHGAISLFTFFVLMLGIIALPALAQTPTETPAMEDWEETATEADAPLTLVWQSEFSPEAALLTPGDITIDSDGNVYVTTQSTNTVKKFDSDGNFVVEWGGNGKDDGEFALSLGIDVDSENNVYVTDFYHSRIQKFDSEGVFLKQWATDESTSPAFLATDHEDNVYIDLFPPHDEFYIQKFDNEGTLLTTWGNVNDQFGGRIEDIAIGPDGALYVADATRNRVQKFDAEGKLIATVGAEASKEGKGLFYNPFSLGIDDDNNMYVLDNNYIQKFDWEGNFVTQWSTAGGDLDKATNVAVDGAGNIYVFAKADVTAVNGNTVNVLVLKKLAQGEAWD